MRNLILLLMIIMLSGCSCHNSVSAKKSNAVYKKIIVYKTKADYYDKVPIILSEDRKEITSFPSPKDLIIDSELRLPEKLGDNFLLDNQGISRLTAFLDMTYEEYSKLPEPPSIDEMKSHILDKDPFIEMYDFKSLSDKPDKIDIIKKLIKKRDFQNAEKIK